MVHPGGLEESAQATATWDPQPAPYRVDIKQERGRHVRLGGKPGQLGHLAVLWHATEAVPQAAKSNGGHSDG